MNNWTCLFTQVLFAIRLTSSLSHPRYLKAIQYRLDKFDNNPQKILEVIVFNTFLERYREKSKKILSFRSRIRSGGQ